MAKNNLPQNRDKKTINEYPVTNQKSSISDNEQAKELLKVLSGEIGTIVEKLLESIYNVDVADSYAEAILKIYSKLLDEGLSQQTVEKIVLEYAGNIDKIVSVLKRNGTGEN